MCLPHSKETTGTEQEHQGTEVQKGRGTILQFKEVKEVWE